MTKTRLDAKRKKEKHLRLVDLLELFLFILNIKYARIQRELSNNHKNIHDEDFRSRPKKVISHFLFLLPMYTIPIKIGLTI